MCVFVVYYFCVF